MFIAVAQVKAFDSTKLIYDVFLILLGRLSSEEMFVGLNILGEAVASGWRKDGLSLCLVWLFKCFILHP